MARLAVALTLLACSAAPGVAARVPLLTQAASALSGLLPRSAPPLLLPPSEDDALPAYFDSRLHWFGCGLTVLDQARARRTAPLPQGLRWGVSIAAPARPWAPASRLSPRAPARTLTHPVRAPQGQCGSCWAVAATAILGDRFCVHKAEADAPISLSGDGAGGSGGLNRLFQYAGNCVKQSESVRNHGCHRKSVFPSPQALISCGSLTENSSLYPQDAGCNGGNAYEAW